MKRFISILAFCLIASPAFSQCLLKQSTATQEISIGPFLDSTDGDTEKTGLTIANTDVRLKKGSADWAAKNSGGATAEEKGNYRITLDATDTATVGILEINVHVSGALNVWKTCYVLVGVVYDEIYGSSALGYIANAPVNVAQFGGSNGTFSGGRPETNMSHIAGSAVSASTAQLGVNVVNFGGSAGTFASGRPEVKVNSIATDAITAAAIQDAAIDRATFAADTGLQSIRSNTAQAGAATTITLDASASAVNSFYNNDLILLTGGTGAGQARFITAYNGTTKVATVATWATNPGATSTFAIIPFDSVAGATAPTAAQITTAVWQDLTSSSDFTTSSSVGKLLKDDIDAAISSRLASGGVTVTTNNDKTGYSLASNSITAAVVASDAVTAIQTGVYTFQKNTAGQKFTIVFYDSTTGNPKTSAAGAACVISKDLGSFASTTNSPVEVGHGFYYVSASQAETNANTIFLYCTATGSKDFNSLMTPQH